MKIRRTGNVIRMHLVWIVGLLIIVFILGCVGVLMPSWLKIIFLAFFIFGVIAVIAALKTKLTMFSDCIEIADLWKIRIIQKESIESVTWEKGCGAAFKLKSGKWEKIPPFGNSHSLANILRAWLNKGE